MSGSRARSHRTVARDRVQHLLDQARTAAGEDRPEDAARYGELAWRVTTRYNLTPAPRLKQEVCRACHAYLLPGRTLRVRATRGKISRTCLACGHVRRIPLTREHRQRRREDPPDEGKQPDGARDVER